MRDITILETFKVGVIKTKTENGRIAKTLVGKPQKDIVVIHRRILAEREDIENGYFTNTKLIFSYGNKRLLEEEMVFWQQSFDTIVRIIEELNKE